jgi:hypothetical protein
MERTESASVPIPPPPAGIQVFPAALSREKQKELRKTQGLKAQRRTFYREGDKVRITTRAYDRLVPAAYFFRECPYKEILAAGADLFYIIRGFPDFGGDEAQIPQLDDLSLDTANKTVPADSSELDFRTTLPYFGTLRAHLHMTDSRQADTDIPEEDFRPVLDELMPQSEREQFFQFKYRFLGQYNPDNAQIAALTGAFIHNNFTNIIFILTDTSTAFDYLEETFYSKFQDYQLYDFWYQNPESKVGAEMMLALACRYKFERRALRSLFKAYAASREFLAKSRFEEDIHNQKAKCLVVKDVYEDLSRRLSEKDFSNLEEIITAYVREEARIYQQMILREQPERNCGFWARGILWWNIGLYDSALTDWNQIDRTLMKSPIWQEIDEIISAAKDGTEMISQVTTALDTLEKKGNEALLLRLLQFGRWLTRTNGRK